MPKKANKYYVYDKPYVYVVFEHAVGNRDGRVHGVYSTKESAMGKANSLAFYSLGYLCILKKPVEGKRVRCHKCRGWRDGEDNCLIIKGPENK